MRSSIVAWSETRSRLTLTRGSIRTFFTGLIFGGDDEQSSAKDGDDEDPLPTPKHYGDPLDIKETDQEKAAVHSDIQDMLRVWGMLDEPAVPTSVFYPNSHIGLRNLAVKIVTDRRFEPACGVFVFACVFLIAVDLDYHKAAPFLSWLLWLSLSAAHSAELTLRVLAIRAQAFRRLLVIDAVVCCAAWLVIPLQGVDDDSPMLAAVKSLGVLKIGRMQALLQADRPVDFPQPLTILAQAVRDSAQPLCSVFVLTLLILLSLALMLTSLLPGAAEDVGEAETEVLLENFGNMALSCFSLLEAMAGSGDYGLDVAAALWAGAGNGKSGALMMLISLGAAAFFVRVAFNALVIGIFLERLFVVSDREQERVEKDATAGHRQFFTRFLALFQDRGYEVSELVSWAQVSALLDELPEVKEWLPKPEARKLFVAVDEDEDGLVQTDQFVFGAFKLRGFSDSVDMRAINYQQTQAVQRIRQLHSDFDLAVAGMQSRLFHISSGLAALDRDLGALHQGSLRVQDLTAELNAKRMAVAALDDEPGRAQEGGRQMADLSVPRQVEELRARTSLNRRLDDVLHTAHSALAALSAEGTQAGANALVEDAADAMVRSVRSALQQDLSELKAMAGAPAALLASPTAPAPGALEDRDPARSSGVG